MASRFIDWLRNLTAKSTTIDGTEQVHLDSAGLSQKALLSDAIRYGGGNSTRVTTIGNANIHQKSDGTMWLEVTGQTAGNARGAGAFDWQAARNSASQVASGSGAVCVGKYSAASTEAAAIGVSVVCDPYAYGVGNSLSVANTSAAFGVNLATINQGQTAFGYGRSSQNSSAQANLQTFYTNTADASATPLSVNNLASNRMVIPAMRACAITGLVTAMSDATDGYKVKAWEIKCIITRDNSNNTRIVGTPTITELGADTEAASWAITSITADNTNESLAITVTGEAATNIRWQASLFYSQVGF